MKNKSEVFLHFCTFKKLVENIFNAKIKAFQSDGDGEFNNTSMLSHFSNSGIFFVSHVQTVLNKKGLLKENINTFLK